MINPSKPKPTPREQAVRGTQRFLRDYGQLVMGIAIGFVLSRL